MYRPCPILRCPCQIKCCRSSGASGLQISASVIANNEATFGGGAFVTTLESIEESDTCQAFGINHAALRPISFDRTRFKDNICADGLGSGAALFWSTPYAINITCASAHHNRSADYQLQLPLPAVCPVSPCMPGPACSCVSKALPLPIAPPANTTAMLLFGSSRFSESTGCTCVEMQICPTTCHTSVHLDDSHKFLNTPCAGRGRYHWI